MITKLGIYGKTLSIESDDLEANLKMSDEVYNGFLETIDKKVKDSEFQEQKSKNISDRTVKVSERFIQDLKDDFGFTDDFGFNFPKDFVMGENELFNLTMMLGAFINALQQVKYGLHPNDKEQFYGYLEKGHKFFD